VAKQQRQVVTVTHCPYRI